MSVVRFKFRFNVLISGKIIKEMPGSVASGTLCIIQYCMIGCGFPSSFAYYEYEYWNLALQTGGVFLCNRSLPVYIAKPG